MSMPDARPMLELILADESATDQLADALAHRLAPGWRIYLTGDLGTGKTRLVRALLRSLGHNGRVRSPTFTLMEPYNLSKFDLYHFDFYRFSSEHDWLDAGFDEWIGNAGAVSVVEWPEMAGDSLPPPDLAIALFFDGDETGSRRRVQLSAATAAGQACLTALQSQAASGHLGGISCATG